MIAIYHLERAVFPGHNPNRLIGKPMEQRVNRLAAHVLFHGRRKRAWGMQPRFGAKFTDRVRGTVHHEPDG